MGPSHTDLFRRVAAAPSSTAPAAGLGASEKQPSGLESRAPEAAETTTRQAKTFAEFFQRPPAAA
jgi:hypothetical protein